MFSPCSLCLPTDPMYISLCSPKWYGVSAYFSWDLWITSWLFNTNCLLICWPHHTWVIIKPTFENSCVPMEFHIGTQKRSYIQLSHSIPQNTVLMPWLLHSSCLTPYWPVFCVSITDDLHTVHKLWLIETSVCFNSTAYELLPTPCNCFVSSLFEGALSLP